MNENLFIIILVVSSLFVFLISVKSQSYGNKFFSFEHICKNGLFWVLLVSSFDN